MQIFLPGQAGGTEVDVSFLYVPRRSVQDQTYAGNRLLSPAWRYVALTRASTACYVLLEEMTAPPQGHQSHKKKVVRWIDFASHCKQVLCEMGVQHHYNISDDWQWPASIYTSLQWRRCRADLSWESWAASLGITFQVSLCVLPPEKPAATTDFEELFQNPRKLAGLVVECEKKTSCISARSSCRVPPVP